MTEGSSSPLSLFRSALAIMQRDIFIYVLSILTGVVIARTLGPELLGVWVLLSLVSSYAEGFGRPKTDVASVYLLGSKKARPEEILFSMTFFAVLSSSLVVILFLWQIDLIQGLLFQKLDINYRKELIFIILIIPLEFLLHNYSYFYIGLEKVAIFNRIRVLQAILNFIVICGLIFFLEFEIWALILARAISIFIPLIYSYINTERSNWMSLSSRWNSALTIEILRYAFNFYIIGVIGHINRLTVKTIAALFFTSSQLAFYNQGESSGRFLNVIPNSLAVILYPRISSIENKQESIDISCQSFRITLVVLGIAGALLYLIANPLIIFLYGIAFEQTADVLKLAIPGVVIGSSCLTLKSYFEGSGQASIIPRLQILPVILLIPLAYYLILYWGLKGAAVSFSLGSAFYGLVILVAFMWINNQSISKILPNLKDLRIITRLVLDNFKKRV